jgi:hypothetical protein
MRQRADDDDDGSDSSKRVGNGGCNLETRNVNTRRNSISMMKTIVDVGSSNNNKDSFERPLFRYSSLSPPIGFPEILYKNAARVDMRMGDPASMIQLQCVIDELKEMRMRMERAERRVQMLTDSFVVSGLWRTSSSLAGWKGGGLPPPGSDHHHHAGGRDEDMPLQFDMTND